MIVFKRKLFKHFIQQLDAKQRVHPKDLLSNLHQFPSLSKLLTLAGVSASLANVSVFVNVRNRIHSFYYLAFFLMIKVTGFTSKIFELIL